VTGAGLVPPCSAWISSSDRLAFFWISSSDSLAFFWISSSDRLAFYWISSSDSLAFYWISSIDSLAFYWISSSDSLAFYWISSCFKLRSGACGGTCLSGSLHAPSLHSVARGKMLYVLRHTAALARLH
jgi:hypothetical protein